MKQTSKRLLSLLLVLMMVVSALPLTVLAADETSITLVTDASSLKAGDKIIFAAEKDGKVYAAGVLSNTYLSSVETPLTSLESGVQTFTLGGTAEAWTLTSSEGQLYTSAARAVNYSGKGTGTWTIAIEDGKATIASTDSTCGRILYNVNSPRFLNYTSATSVSMLLPSIYKVDGSGTDPDPGPTPDPESPLEAGDRVVIYNPANLKALSTTYNGFYNNGTNVTVADGVVSGYTDADIWTVGVNEDGTYTFSTADGKKLAMGDSYSSTPLDEVNSNWNVTAAETEGCYYIKNTVRGMYLEWFDSKGNWSAYGSITPENEGLFAQAFYKITGEIPGPEPEVQYAEKMTALPKNGDTVIIYNSGNAMGSAANGTKLSGVEAALDGTKLPISEGMAQLLVSTDGDNYIFTLNGKYLTSGETGNSLSFAEELTDCGKWTAAAATDGSWYLKNVGANYKGNYNQALEYYNGFTTYGLNDTDAAYQMQFFLVSEAGVLADGDKVVIYNPANLKALSSTYDGYYNSGTDVTLEGDTLSGFTGADVWTVGVDTDGNYTFSTADGKKLSMGDSYTSMPLDDKNTGWIISEAKTTDLYYIQNAVRKNYVEWYADKGTWSGAGFLGEDALFAQAFYKITGDIPEPGPDTGLPAEGAKVVIYNVAAQGVLAAQDDNAESPSINGVGATIADGKATVENGGVVFTVEKNGDYFRFVNETYGYLCSNGTGNNAFYSTTASEDADWTLAVQGNGYIMESRTAKYNGKYSQYLEYYADSYKTYSMYGVTDYSIYTFQFYPVANNDNLTGGIVNVPTVVFGTLADAYLDQAYTFTFTVDAVFGVQELSVKVGESPVTVTKNEGVYTVTIPAEQVTGDELSITVSGKDGKDVEFTGTETVAVKDEPVISNLTPAAGSETGDNKRPVISADISNAGENPTVVMKVNDVAVDAVYENGKVTYTPAEDLADGRTTVTVTVKRADGKEATAAWSFTVGEAQFQLYFGQLHSHTTYSDGSGSLDSALEYIQNLPDNANVDFAAFTDHSNYFDKSGAANPESALYDMSLASEYSQDLWAEYKRKVADFNASQNSVIALGGFEMTWSGGPGHINTFNTPGIVSRNNTTLNNKTDDAGMKAYYALLSQAEGADSLSQFNHPGSTFGTFSDFAYWDPVIDSRIFMVEVGNGEGQIGAGGYYPSYEYYTMALDKGWHVAPTNNQDNHKGKWGNANDARDVILTDDFSEQGLYEAIRNYRLYATEDKNLEIGYTVNDQMMGYSFADIPEKLNINVTVNDPDASDSISKVEVIVNSGKVAHTWNDPAELARGSLSVELEPTYSYYYIRVTEGDGDLAVTAPVWVGESLKLGISSLECGTSTPVTGEELTLTTTLFNSESKAATVKSLTYAVKDGAVIGTDSKERTIPASGTLAVDFQYTPETAKVMTITVTTVVSLNDEEYTFTKDIELDIQDADQLVYIGLDGSHYNEYINGHYTDTMGNFSILAAGYNVRLVELKTQDAFLEACANENGKFKALVLTAPTRRDLSDIAKIGCYTQQELAAVKAFNEAGGVVLVMGYSDFYETAAGDSTIGASLKPEEHMAAQQNLVLAALGSSLRLGDDQTSDSKWNDGRQYGIFASVYGESKLLDGLVFDPENPNDMKYSQQFSQYGGCSVYVADATGNATTIVPDTVTPVVYGNDSTVSTDSDQDGLGGTQIPLYNGHLMLLATEQIGTNGMILVTGGTMMADWQLQVKPENIDSGSDQLYANFTIMENLLKMLNPVSITPIETVQKQTEVGYKYTIEGVVTSNASGYDKNTAFFDCIYVQDETGGVCCFPVAGNFKIGDKVRVTGTTDFYQGEMELQVTSIEKIGDAEPVTPKKVTAAQVNNGSVLGQLITLKGTVVSFEKANGLVQTIMVKDENGNVARVFIDGYITTDKDVENLEVGCNITVTGLASYDNTFNAPEGPFPRIRIRNRADVVCTEADKPVAPVNPGKPSTPVAPAELPFRDVSKRDWFYQDVKYVYENGIMNGVSDQDFAPNQNLTRGMIVTILYRMENTPKARTAGTFTDVTAGQWYTDAVEWAAAHNIVNGYGNGKFGPNDPVTREQLAAILYRYAQYKSRDVSVGEDTNILSYNDAFSISEYAIPALQWACGEGLINGADGNLMPADHATRAQVAAIIHRYLEG